MTDRRPGNPGAHEADAAETSRVTDLLRGALSRTEAGLPPGLRPAVPRAMLDLAVGRVLAEEGAIGAATVLVSFADAILDGAEPPRDGAARIPALDP